MTPRELHHAAPLSDAAPLRRDGLPEDLPRLVNSVILPGFVGTTAPQWLVTALRDRLAGVVYFGHNIDPDAAGQVLALSEQIRAANPHAVIGVDEEGGNVTRLQARDGSTIPGAAVLGALNDPELTEAAGRAIGRLCREAGINLTVAPVADVNTNPRNPVIGVRAFGADTELVSTHAAAAVRGIQSQRVAACAKHFPGHGDTMADSHMDTARVELSLQEMKAHHLPPFQAATDAGTAAMMSAHIIIPDLGEAPATLNPAASALLREMGFEGVLITDALDMAAVRATVGPGEGGVLALLAGNDLLCVGNPLNAYTTGRDDESCYKEVFDAVLAAAESGRLPLEVLRKASARAQSLAEWAAVAPEPEKHDAVSWVSVAARACRVDSPGTQPVLDGSGYITVVDLRTGHNMAAGPTENFLAAALDNATEGNYSVAVLDAAELSGVELEMALMQAGTKGTIVAVADALDDPDQQANLELVFATVPGAVCINAGLAPAERTPFHAIHAHGFSKVTAQAVAGLLESR